MKSNPCKKCGSPWHTKAFCWSNNYKIRTVGKKAKKWNITRKEWLKQNPPPNGYYNCYLRLSPHCLVWMEPSQMTLDHVIPRSNRPDLSYDFDNLKPACRICNTLKGSRKLEQLYPD